MLQLLDEEIHQFEVVWKVPETGGFYHGPAEISMKDPDRLSSPSSMSVVSASRSGLIRDSPPGYACMLDLKNRCVIPEHTSTGPVPFSPPCREWYRKAVHRYKDGLLPASRSDRKEDSFSCHLDRADGRGPVP